MNDAALLPFCPAASLTLEWLTAVGEAPPPPQTKVTIVGKNKIYRRENLTGPFLVHKLLGPRPSPLPFF